MNHANDAIRQRIEAAEQESFHASEVCGSRKHCGKAIGLSPSATSTREHTGPASEHQGCSRLSQSDLDFGWHTNEKLTKPTDALPPFHGSVVVRHGLEYRS